MFDCLVMFYHNILLLLLIHRDRLKGTTEQSEWKSCTSAFHNEAKGWGVKGRYARLPRAWLSSDLCLVISHSRRENFFLQGGKCQEFKKHISYQKQLFSIDLFVLDLRIIFYITSIWDAGDLEINLLVSCLHVLNSLLYGLCYPVIFWIGKIVCIAGILIVTVKITNWNSFIYLQMYCLCL